MRTPKYTPSRTDDETATEAQHTVQLATRALDGLHLHDDEIDELCDAALCDKGSRSEHAPKPGRRMVSHGPIQGSTMAKAFIFDVDGTLVDSVAIHAEVWQKAFRAFGHEIAFEALRGQIGKGGSELMPVFLSRDELEAKGEAIDARRAEILERAYLSKIEPFSKVRELFQRLRDDGFEIALASSAKGKELETYKHKARIADLVAHETSSDDAERAKPHGDIFQAALDRLDGVTPDDAIVVGDTPYDAEAAGKVGLRTIGLLCGGFSEADMRDAGCVAIYKDPADILAHYDEVVRRVPE